MRRLPDAIEAGLLALALVLPFSLGATNIILGVLSPLALAGLVVGPLKWRRSWNLIFISIVVYACVGFATAALGTDPGRSYHDAIKDWHKLWVIVVLLPSFSAKRETRVPWALAIAFSAAAIVGIWQSATERVGWMWMRAHGWFHPVTYGEMMALALLGGLCLLAHKEARRPWLAFYLALCGAALILSQTRGAALGLAAGFAAVCWLKERLRRWMVPGAGALAVAALVWEVMPNGGRSFSALLHASQQGRFQMWGAAWRMFRDRPWTGVGPGNYNELFPNYFHGAIEKQAVWGSAHNLFLHQLAERGLLGAAALVFVLGVLTLGAWRRAQKSSDARDLWAWGAMIAFLFMNITEVAFQNELMTTLLLFIWCWSQGRPA
jgi:O-antigen ligase